MRKSEQSKYNSLGEWAMASPAAYIAASKEDFISEICQKFGWNEDEHEDTLIEIASEQLGYKNAIECSQLAIKEIKALDSNYVKSCFSAGLDMLFNSKGNFIKFGIDSFYPMQVRSEGGNNRNRVDAISSFKRDIEIYQSCIEQNLKVKN